MTLNLFPSLFGGLYIGIAVAYQIIFNGKIAGISGLFYQSVYPILKETYFHFAHGPQNKSLSAKIMEITAKKQWKADFAFIFGIFFGGAVIRVIFPQFFITYNPFFAGSSKRGYISTFLNQPFFLLPLIGVLEGIGTKLANGCTSGHMICGIARLSPRSFAATATFCGICFLMVNFFGRGQLISEMYGPDFKGVKSALIFFPGTSVFMWLIIEFAILAGIFYFLWIQGLANDHKHANADEEKEYLAKTEMIHFGVAFVSGFAFGTGLAFAGMTKPQKVAGFFSLFRNWDPSLIFVVLGAVVPNYFVFEYVKQRNTAGKKPVFSDKYGLPTQTQITPDLIAGAAFFGLGWGILCCCPGPLIASGFGSPFLIVWLLTFAVGEFLGDKINEFRNSMSQKK